MRAEIKNRIEQIRQGKVPAGYKKTKQGISPAEWTGMSVKDCLCRVEKPVQVEPETLYTQIGIRSHGNGIFYKEPVTGRELKNKSVFWIEPDCFILNIVFAWEQAVGRTTKAEKGMIGSHRFPMYRPIEDRVDIDYLVYYFLTPRGTNILEEASPGGAGRNRTLGQERFLKSTILLPPIAEQQKIAKILMTQDRVIALREKLLAEKLRQKQYLMQVLLTGKKRLPGFTDRWNIKKIGDICIINPLKEKQYPKRISFLEMAAVDENGNIINEQFKDYTSVKTGYTPFKRGDILIAKITPCFENGKGALTTNLSLEYGFGSTEFHVLRCKDVDNTFLYYHTVSASFRKRLAGEMVGSAGQKRIQENSIRNYPIAIPSLKEQRAIDNVLATADREINLLRQILEQERRKKKALMQLLLSGIVRVKP